MTTPFPLIGVTLLLWGWQTGLSWLGVALALLTEGSRLVSRRWLFSATEFRRVVVLSNLLLALLLVYGLAQAASQHSGRVIHLLVQWLPLALYPLLLVQAYGSEERIAISSLSLLKARTGAEPVSLHPLLINLAWPYWGICLLAASVAPATQSAWFYPCCCLLACLALWKGKTPATSTFVWAAVLAVVITTGLLGHIGLHRLHGKVEDQVTRLFEQSGGGKEDDSNRSRTAIGRIGSLKLSNRIVLRVAGSGLSIPLLLREATYTTLVDTTWVAREPALQTLRPEGDGTTWQLGQPGSTEKRMRIVVSRDSDKGLLAVPPGASRITGLTADELSRNRLGTVVIAGGPTVISYQVEYVPQSDTSGPPTDLDLQVPARLKPVLSQVAAELKLVGLLPEEAASRLSGYFSRQFRYATVQVAREAGKEPLDDFLLKSKAGHCEYFATATVLLLRSAGIPARYVTGYSVMEFSPLETVYIVRQRHAHAWCQIFSNGAWRDLDTTPPDWYSLEQGAASRLHHFSDLANWVMFRFTIWKEQAHSGGLARYGLWLLVLLLLYPVWKLLRSIRRTTVDRDTEHTIPPLLPGHDSEWYLLEREFARTGLERHPWEPLADWVDRVGETSSLPVNKATLLQLMELHYRYRFDPLGISGQEREELRKGVKDVGV